MSSTRSSATSTCTSSARAGTSALREARRARRRDDGVAFAVWAPNAAKVSVVGEWNGWDGRVNPMEQRGVVRHLGGRRRRRARGRALPLRDHDAATGSLLLKSDPYAFAAEMPPGERVAHLPLAPRVGRRRVARAAARGRAATRGRCRSTRCTSARGAARSTTSRSTTASSRTQLGAYVKDLGFTHVELLPVMEHPYSGSWGYQVTGYFAPTARFGDPDDFRAFVDELHRQGIGVILDWVPAHFPRDDWALARFDGTALYEHEDPRRGAHPDWGTLVFNYGRNEVRNFLLSNALYWLREFHADGLRVDAVASMLYLDYSRKEGEWMPNEFGGREDLDAVVVPAAAERGRARPRAGRRSRRRRSRPRGRASRGRSTSAASASASSGTWAGCTTRSTTSQREPIHRRFHHHQLTFSLVYAFSENFILPLSHDEVVHGKGSLVEKMPGDRWQKLANLRALYALHVGAPGQEARSSWAASSRSGASGTPRRRSTGTCSRTATTRACSRSCAT